LKWFDIFAKSSRHNEFHKIKINTRLKPCIYLENKLKYENWHQKLLIIIIFNNLIETPFNTKFGVSFVSWWVFILLIVESSLLFNVTSFWCVFFPSFQFCDLHPGYGKKFQSFAYFKYDLHLGMKQTVRMKIKLQNKVTLRKTLIARWRWIKWPHTHLHTIHWKSIGS
jgi:hypothetical protein